LLAKPKAGDVRFNHKDGAEMVWVPAGDFLMGSTDQQINDWLRSYPWHHEAFESEQPQHRIYLDGYWIYKTEVTVRQYNTFCQATRRQMPDTPDWGWHNDNPIVNVSWEDATAYAIWAGAALPTESQWEKAARGTDRRIFPWGNEWDVGKCSNSVSGKQSRPSIVGSYPSGKSPYGCLDMAGNVWEWCEDAFIKDFYTNSPSYNPKAQDANNWRVIRGGCWSFDAPYVFHCAYRDDLPSDLWNDAIGFRCVLTPEP